MLEWCEGSFSVCSLQIAIFCEHIIGGSTLSHCCVHMHCNFECSVVILFKRANVGRVVMRELTSTYSASAVLAVICFYSSVNRIVSL